MMFVEIVNGAIVDHWYDCERATENLRKSLKRCANALEEFAMADVKGAKAWGVAETRITAGDRHNSGRGVGVVKLRSGYVEVSNTLSFEIKPGQSVKLVQFRPGYWSVLDVGLRQ